MSCDETFACEPTRTPKTHSSCWGTPTADNGLCLASELYSKTLAFLKELRIDRARHKKDGLNSLNIERSEHHRALGRGFLLCKKNFGTPYASKHTGTPKPTKERFGEPL